MAKIDDTLSAVTSGFQDVEWRSGNAWVPDEQIETLGVRRKKAGDTQHLLTYLSIGERNQQPTVFWGNKFSDALKKAMKWRGMETKSKRGPKKAAGQAPA